MEVWLISIVVSAFNRRVHFRPNSGQCDERYTVWSQTKIVKLKKNIYFFYIVPWLFKKIRLTIYK
jgi:hypothetical protein